MPIPATSTFAQPSAGLPIDTTDLLACSFGQNSLLIHECSTSLIQTLGLESMEELRGRYVLDLFTPRSFEDLERYLRRRDFRGSVLCSLASSSGLGPRVAVTITQGPWNARRNLLRLLCVPIDDQQARISALRARVDALEGQNRGLRELTNLLVHDLRNTLHTVSTGVELIQRSAVLETTPAQQLERVHQATAVMNDILAGVMKHLRFEVGDYPMELTDLNLLVDELVLALPPPQGKTLKLRRTAVLPSIVCERSLVQELFRNLVGNAIAYTTGPLVPIEIGLDEAAGTNPVVFVRDEGVGIPAADLDRIFAPFGRADHMKLNDRGTGLGMVLVKRIVERHGGRIWIESEVNSGTTVKFTLAPSPSVTHARFSPDRG